MDYSGISNKTLLGRLLRIPLKLIPTRTIIPIIQGRLKGKKWIVGSSIHGCWLGSYELGKQKLFVQTVTSGSIVFDLGGNVGFYTLLASELVGPSGKVYVFEPVPRNLRYLKEHLRLNNILNVEVIEAAVSDSIGFVSFDEGQENSMGHIVDTGGTLQVKTVVLDQLHVAGDVYPPTFMKIDIEGAELSALRGAIAILAEFHPTIFLATHGSNVHRECVSLLMSLDYDLQSIDGKNIEQSCEILATYKS